MHVSCCSAPLYGTPPLLQCTAFLSLCPHASCSIRIRTRDSYTRPLFFRMNEIFFQGVLVLILWLP